MISRTIYIVIFIRINTYRQIRDIRRTQAGNKIIDHSDVVAALSVEYVGTGLTWGWILSTCVISMCSNDMKYKYKFMFPVKKIST